MVLLPRGALLSYFTSNFEITPGFRGGIVRVKSACQFKKSVECWKWRRIRKHEVKLRLTFLRQKCQALKYWIFNQKSRVDERRTQAVHFSEPTLSPFFVPRTQTRYYSAEAKVNPMMIFPGLKDRLRSTTKLGRKNWRIQMRTLFVPRAKSVFGLRLMRRRERF